MKTPEECVQDILKFEHSLPTCTRCNGRGHIKGWFGQIKDCKCYKGKLLDEHWERFFELTDKLMVCREVFAKAEQEINDEKMVAYFIQQRAEMRDNIEQAKQYLRDTEKK